MYPRVLSRLGWTFLCIIFIWLSLFVLCKMCCTLVLTVAQSYNYSSPLLLQSQRHWNVTFNGLNCHGHICPHLNVTYKILFSIFGKKKLFTLLWSYYFDKIFEEMNNFFCVFNRASHLTAMKYHTEMVLPRNIFFTE